MAAQGTSLSLDITIKPNFTPMGVFTVTADDPGGPVVQAVTVSSGTNGSYVLTLTSSASTGPGRYNGLIILNLCADAACGTHQIVPSVTVPRDITILGSTDPWPGDHQTTLSALSGAGDWATFQRDNAHTGFVPVTLDPNLFSTRWQIATGSANVSFTNLPGHPIVTADGKVFVNDGNLLYARRESDGSIAWQYDFSTLQFPSSNPAAVADGAVYVAAGQQSSTYLFSFNQADGALRFKSPMSSQWETYLNPVVSANGVYTNAGTYGGLYGFDTTGHQLFFAGLAQTSLWSPALDATAVYAYTGDLRILDPVTGAVIKSIPDPTFTNYIYEIHGAPVLGVDSVFAANYANSFLNGGGIGNTLLRFRPSTSSVAWMVAGNFPATPAYANGVLYIGNQNPVRLEARAEADGALLWNWVPPLAGDSQFFSEPMLTNNMIFISTNLNAYGLDLATRKVVWTWPHPARFALSGNGVLYLVERDHLTAINAK
jgi:outer membrane protein assembly factor BamB